LLAREPNQPLHIHRVLVQTGDSSRSKNEDVASFGAAEPIGELFHEDVVALLSLAPLSTDSKNRRSHRARGNSERLNPERPDNDNGEDHEAGNMERKEDCSPRREGRTRLILSVGHREAE
jgi:hypothetical protein